MTRRLLVAIAAVLVFAGPAAAHGGARLTTVGAGAYSATVDASLVTLDGGRILVDVTTYLRDRRTGLPVNGAQVTVTASAPGEKARTQRALPFANTYEVLVPLAHPADWRRVHLQVHLDGPVGRAAFSYSPRALAWTWAPDPVVLSLAGIGLLLFGQGFVRLRRRGRSDWAAGPRVLLFAAGLGLATLPLVSPLDSAGDEYLLSAHMLQHMLIGDAAPALLLVAVRGPLGFFLLPPVVLGPLARFSPLRRALHFLLRPAVSLGAWAVAFGAWHVPAAYDYAAAHQWAHDLEHLSFVAAGLLVWSQLVDPTRRARLTRGRRLAYAGALFAMGTALCDVLVFSFHPLYPSYARQAVRLLSLSPVRDQQLAGLVMELEQLLTLGTLAFFLLRPRLRRATRA